MIKNFFTVAIRSFLRQKLYSLINVAGLASGLVCVLFIYLWVVDEVTKDKFHREGEKIYRVVSNLSLTEGEILTWTVVPGPLAEDIADNFKDVEIVVRAAGDQMVLEYEGKKFTERGYFADPKFFDLFSFRILKGKPFTKPGDVSAIAMSDKVAAKVFGGNAEAMGKTIVINGRNHTIECIFEHPDNQSTLQFGFVVPYEVYRKNRGDGFNWENYDHPLYVKVDPKNVADVTNRINERSAARAEDKDFLHQILATTVSGCVPARPLRKRRSRGRQN